MHYHCTMCSLYRTIALYPKAEIQKATFPFEKKYFFSYSFFRVKTLKLVYFLFAGTRKIIFGTLKMGQNNLEIANLEFESHGFLENHVFFPTEQAGTNIC